jgi:BTB/POZ domain-containing protein 9
MTAASSVELIARPIFDFSSNYENQELCDCDVIIDGEIFPAHRIVLANSATFFFNAFTSGMQEETTSTVTIQFNPLNLLPTTSGFLYSGRITVDAEEFIPLIDVAHYYGIDQLTQCLTEYLEKTINAENALAFADRCYRSHSTTALHLLIPILRRHFQDLSIPACSEVLEIATFCEVAGELPRTKAEAVKLLDEFLGSYSPNPDEVAAMAKAALDNS